MVVKKSEIIVWPNHAAVKTGGPSSKVQVHSFRVPLMKAAKLMLNVQKPQRLIRCSDSTMSMSDSVLECCILRLLSSHICLDLSVPRPAIPKRRGRREF